MCAPKALCYVRSRRALRTWVRCVQTEPRLVETMNESSCSPVGLHPPLGHTTNEHAPSASQTAAVSLTHPLCDIRPQTHACCPSVARAPPPPGASPGESSRARGQEVCSLARTASSSAVLELSCSVRSLTTSFPTDNSRVSFAISTVSWDAALFAFRDASPSLHEFVGGGSFQSPTASTVPCATTANPIPTMQKAS
jgi:hypothetical protein